MRDFFAEILADLPDALLTAIGVGMFVGFMAVVAALGAGA